MTPSGGTTCRQPYQQIDPEGLRKAAGRPRPIRHRGCRPLVPHLLRKLVAQSTELSEFVFEFEAQSPHAGLRERVDAFADDAE